MRIEHAIGIGLTVATMGLGLRASQPISQAEIEAELQSGMSRGFLTESIVRNDACLTEKMPLPDFINEFYVIVGQTVYAPEEARIVFVGENHYNAMHRVLNTHLIVAITQPGDILLTEGVSQGEAVTSENEDMVAFAEPCGYFNGLVIQGWDSRYRLQRVTRALELMLFATTPNESIDAKGIFDQVALYDRNNDLKHLGTKLMGNPQYQSSTFVINAGHDHFLKDESFQAYLSQYPYMALIPKANLDIAGFNIST